MDLFPKRSAFLSDCYYTHFSNAGIAAAADFPVYKRELIFPSIKERGGSTRSKFVQNVRLFSQLRFKTIISGVWPRLSIGDIVVGIPD
jgi:hypothetical protein